MSDMQGFLFGNATDVVDDEVARTELRLLAWNVQSPSLERTRRQLDWLYQSLCNVLVLTEVKAGDGSAHLAKDLESNGFDVHLAELGPGEKYANLIATKGYRLRPLHLGLSSPRLTGVRLAGHLGELDVIALYALTNGMTADSSRARAAFQHQVLAALAERIAAEPEVPLVVTGDFNVLEPGHVPPSTLFEDHDYAFYRALADLGLLDAYRLVRPQGSDLSWYGPHGGQRLDHTFVTAALRGDVADCGFDHQARTSKLSDHSAMTLTLGPGRQADR